MKKEEFKIFAQLLDAGHDPQPILDICLEETKAAPEESLSWFVGSKAFQILNDAETALKMIEMALELEPMNMEYTFQLFNVYIQMSRPDAIVSWINSHSKQYDEPAKALLRGYLTESIAAGLVVKHELSVDVLSYLLKNSQSPSST